MTVKELMEKLRSFPEETTVLIHNLDWGYCPLEEIKKCTIVETYTEEEKGNDNICVDNVYTQITSLHIGDSFVGLR